MELVGSFMTLPEIWERCADDLTDKWYPRTDNTVYLLVIEGNDLIGIIEIDGTTSIEMTIHPYLLKKKRHKGREMMRLFFEFFLKMDYMKVAAIIPICYQQVFNFATKLGFKLEGIKRQSAIKQGKILDQWVIGITRSEIEERYGRFSR